VTNDVAGTDFAALPVPEVDGQQRRPPPRACTLAPSLFAHSLPVYPCTLA